MVHFSVCDDVANRDNKQILLMSLSYLFNAVTRSEFWYIHYFGLYLTITNIYATILQTTFFNLFNLLLMCYTILF